jgi:hypothetical protein
LSDHKPLIFALNRVSWPSSGHQQHHLAFISEYISNLISVPGISKVVAYKLYRPPSGITAAAAAPACSAVTDRPPINLREMPLHQILCPQVQSLPSSKELRIVTYNVSDLDLLGDVTTSTF